MKEKLKRTLTAFCIALPLVFVLIFFGYFPLRYDVVLHTDNIVGEGMCETYVCPTVGYAAFYNVQFYFGSELKKATIQGYHYDVDPIELITSDVSSFEITGLDSYVHGLHLGHFEPEDILPEGETVEGSTAVLSSRGGALHVDVRDPDVGSTVRFSLPFIPGWFRAVYFAVLVLLAALAALGLELLLRRLPALRVPLLSAGGIAVALLAGCFFCGSLPYVTYIYFLLNWLLLFAAALLLNALTLPFLGTVLTMAFTTVWYIANYYVILFRNKPILPADLKAIGTAAEVMGGYDFTPSWQMVLGVIVTAGYAVLLVLVWKAERPQEKQPLKKQLVRRGALVLAAAALMLIGVNTQTFKSLNIFAWDARLLKSFHEEGMVLTYLKCASNARVKTPEGYSRELVDSYLAEYQPQEAEGVRPVNIIMVMDEAFSDLRTVGLDPAVDVMPFIDSLDENAAEGRLYVSIFGGGTCNTEFEGLTGNTLAFLGTGAYPYTENVTEPLFSLASYFRSLGYGTEAFHANVARNWNRNTVYPNLGFEAFHDIEDYEAFGEVTYLHEQPADVSDYRYMEAVSADYAGQPRFLFNVTMQNHSGYERWLDVEKAESVAENGSELYVDTQIYLSLIKASDDAVRSLVETYRDSDEPTMIVYFGDHQPGLPVPAINELYTGVETFLDLYQSKFFIWTNYETETVHDVEISANYLPWLILERGNFPLPPYVQMLQEVHEKYPVISAMGVMDAEGNVYDSVNDLPDDPLIQKYRCVQYANLFDELDPAWFEVK